MSLRTAIVGTSLSVVIGFAHPFAQVPDRDEFEASTRPLSPSVAGTFLMRERRIELLVLWRDAPGWLNVPQSASYSGGKGTFRASLQYGAIRLDFSYDRPCRTVRIENVVVPLSPGQNVIMVDDVDHSSGGPAITAFAVELRVDGKNPSLASVLGRSSEIVSFLIRA